MQITLPKSGPASATLDVSRGLAASLPAGRHALSSARLEREYGEGPLTPSARTRIAAELDHAGLVILSEACNDPLVVAKRAEPQSVEVPATASHGARRVKVLADQAADEAARSGRPVALAPMADADREIVRAHLRWRVDLVARSEGEGAERHIVVLPI